MIITNSQSSTTTSSTTSLQEACNCPPKKDVWQHNLASEMHQLEQCINSNLITHISFVSTHFSLFLLIVCIGYRIFRFCGRTLEWNSLLTGIPQHSPNEAHLARNYPLRPQRLNQRYLAIQLQLWPKKRQFWTRSHQHPSKSQYRLWETEWWGNSATELCLAL